MTGCRRFGSFATNSPPASECGAFEKHLKQLRVALWRSVEATRDEVLRTFPAGTRVNHPEGGFVLWIQLPDRYNGLEIQRRAAAERIHILAGEWFSPTRQYRNYTRISCGHPFEVIQPAVRTLEQRKVNSPLPMDRRQQYT